MSGSWISPVLSLLTSDKTPLETTLTNFEESWVVSGEKLGSLVGCIIAAYLTDKIGRKRILLLSAIPFCVSMMGATLAKTATVFIILRFIGGLGTGIVFVVLPIYVGEIADKDIRGRLNVLRIILGTLGSVYVYSVGPFISYIVLSITCGIVPIVFALIFVFMPESPHFLIKTCKVAEATESLRQLSQKNLNEEALILDYKTFNDM
ncbi:hypothetical protein FQR65_LT10560 [Abscondita terminalis]|nr:hypothetical protein FQR65_LT10560 [Abscondita terminalis]